MNPKERFDELNKKGLCSLCLTPGRKAGHWGRCFDKYACPDPSHTSSEGVHILVCDKHKTNPDILKLLEEYSQISTKSLKLYGVTQHICQPYYRYFYRP